MQKVTLSVLNYDKVKRLLETRYWRHFLYEVFHAANGDCGVICLGE